LNSCREIELLLNFFAAFGEQLAHRFIEQLPTDDKEDCGVDEMEENIPRLNV
jgi:hypothetical protein